MRLLDCSGVAKLRLHTLMIEQGFSGQCGAIQEGSAMALHELVTFLASQLRMAAEKLERRTRKEVCLYIALYDTSHFSKYSKKLFKLLRTLTSIKATF